MVQQRIIFFLYVLFHLLPGIISGQGYNFTQYNVKDGLAGSIVYCIGQDKDGFLWFGTETGVSRYDGTHFRNFTAEDGLPDIEVLKIFPDSKGRVWMAPFRKSVCYYEKGKIHNQQNDSILARIELKGNIEGFEEDKSGNILMKEQTRFHLLTPLNNITEFGIVNGDSNPSFDGVGRSNSGNFLIMDNGNLYEFADGKFKQVCSIEYHSTSTNFLSVGRNYVAWRSPADEIIARNYATGEESKIPFSITHVCQNIIDDSLLFVNRNNNSYSYNMSSGKALDSFRIGSAVSFVLKDSEKNIWFGTLGEGVYKLNSQDFHSIALPIGSKKHVAIHAIAKIQQKLYLGSNINSISVLSLPSYALENTYFVFKEGEVRVLLIDTLKNDDLIDGSDVGITKLNKDFTLKISEGTKLKKLVVKGIYKKNENEWYVATSFNVVIFDPVNYIIRDTLWNERATAVFVKKDTIYIGTLSGLYEVHKDKSSLYLGNGYAGFTKRISGIVEAPDGTLWIATYDSGIIGYKNNRVISTINMAGGLTSNNCKTIYIHGNSLWAGTDKGLNEINLIDPSLAVKTYSAGDGLASDVINTVFVDSNMVYVGTPAGLSFFDKSKINTFSICQLHFLDILNAGIQIPADSDEFTLDWNRNNIRFDFAGISYKSGGKISYFYRLNGLDSTWKRTKESFLEYPTLPSGRYRIEIYAVNKFGIQSETLTRNFTVRTPFWNNIRFQLLTALIFLGAGALLVFRRFKKLRIRHAQRESISRKIVELEHMAVRSQMNPHFIFNCLNSIQQFIFNRDVVDANNYITRFAKLIRATLQNSSRTYVSLAEELDYITTYLELEQSRFRENMYYTIDVDLNLNPEEYFVPSMILQPFVENSIRHGIRNKLTGDGKISISLNKENEQLICIITDNGVGRRKAKEYKALDQSGYQSKGMYLTSERIKLLNSVFNYQFPIELLIIDLETENGIADGTRVILKFPMIDNPQQLNG